MSNILLDELAEKINTKLKDSHQLAPYALKARVYENGLVRIQGIVDVLEEKMQAEELVWTCHGVKKVENNITVCTDGDIDDFDVAFEVSEELHANPEIPHTVGVKVNGGEVQLVGSVNNYSEVQEAIETASKARGVREVVSRLKMTDTLDDISINNSVQTALMDEPGIIPGRIKTVTRNGVVSIMGNLPESQAILTMETISKVPGVKSIKNLLNHAAGDIDDRIVISFLEEMAANPYLNEQAISIEVNDGAVTLSGEIDSFKAKRDIEEILHKILNQYKQKIYRVENKLRLKD